MTGSHGGGPVDRAGTEAAMGARHGDDGGADRAVPRTAGRATPGAEGLLAAALRDERVGAEGERRAVAAFRTARDAQPGRAARTRRRDDWRPRQRCRARRSSRAALSVLLASLTLGGVAYAAIGGSGSAPDATAPDRARPTPGPDATADRHTADPLPVVPPPARTAPGTSAPPGPGATAPDTEVGCRAYERLEGRGKALDAAVWQRLVAAAGGEEGVAAHCAAQRARQASPSTASDPAEPGRAGIPAGPGRSKGDADGAGKGTGAEKKAQRADRAPGGDA
ncbi:hypothetical protein SAM40697_4208 [Streptomyces ambofaciens]|uniref:Uncharacterized protein n=1 Tax=Streptomyces ambofaciens TaxID=1889 RepID=A0ABM6B3A3_STRAM|nr:hypothetical protein [Streptomyces ambofaciens]ANB08166.1 hypothetical protein SAM40697_4208 [Streptomyces ambofaciens]